MRVLARPPLAARPRRRPRAPVAVPAAEVAGGGAPRGLPSLSKDLTAHRARTPQTHDHKPVHISRHNVQNHVPCTVAKHALAPAAPDNTVCDGPASETPVPAVLALPFGLLRRLFPARWQLFVVVGVAKATEVAIIIEVIRVIFQLS